ncbi:DUF3703 domain-containing protein [Tenacibaculum sp. 1_MG-2023]|uniref:DUF3703 domain-containing protein n=1 Tax=Tenacibaculum sp. 1_MG-2023 TaxID=3062653 RepID=UPI0026E3F686|nr:DUF3703 domain-containing protein [Tenacibaculum sp. 1_MG-2023]MDO6675546.1 DUF3703 domain-containing protein [Tenacibaculum sp. 1_MG-2023]
MTQLQRKQQFYKQLILAKKALKSKHFKVSFYHLENTHILGQKHVYRHTLSHYWMLVHGIKTHSLKEVIGQLFRIIASVLFTLFWVPKGNTGGSNISATKPIPVRKELQKYF